MVWQLPLISSRGYNHQTDLILPLNTGEAIGQSPRARAERTLCAFANALDGNYTSLANHARRVPPPTRDRTCEREFINGRIYQKPLPQGKHSVLSVSVLQSALRSFNSLPGTPFNFLEVPTDMVFGGTLVPI